MPVVGIICGCDQSFQPFDVCIKCHETYDTERNCGVPVASIKSQRDNGSYRLDAGFSASVLLSCPRAYAIEQLYDIYESVISGYNKFRGTLVHAMFEADPDPPPYVVRERRVERYVDVNGVSMRVSGKPDYADPEYHVLLDYKSKHILPTKPDPRHEAQVNIYRWLLAGGRFCDTGEESNITIDRLGVHYITFNTKMEKTWKKMLYPVWPLELTEAFVIERLTPLVEWQNTNVLPQCGAYQMNPFWTCDCVKLTEQLKVRGIDIE